MNEPNISDYGLIGDTRTAALCSVDGSIDWMCAPSFDSEPIFGRLLGGAQNGSFALTVEDVVHKRRRYRGESADLETAIAASEGAGRLVDGMALEVEGSLLPSTVLVRTLICDRGTLRARILFDPKAGLPGTTPRTGRRAGTLVCDWGSLAVTLQSFPDIALSAGQETVTELSAGSTLTLVMTIADRAPAILLSADSASRLLEETERW
ncbi:MAG: trehalase-like domain-containing protein [Actinomycetota bacterium]